MRAGFVSIISLLTISNIIAKILGFGKDILISYYYGTSDLTDGFFLAFSIPTIIIGVFTASTDSAIIPQYNRLYLTAGRKEADQNFSNIINVISVIGIILSVIICVFPSFFVELFAPGFNDEQRQFSIFFLRLFSFLGVFHILFCFFCSYTIRYKHVVTRSILAFSTNVIVILALFIQPDPRMIFPAIAFLVGSVIQGVLPIYSAVRIGYEHEWSINIKSKEFKTFLMIFMPIMLASFLVELNMFVDRFVASNFGNGSVSSLNYAIRLTSIFDTMMVVGIGVVILPYLSKLNVSGDKKKMKESSTQILKVLFVCLLPFAIFSFLLSDKIIEIVYMRGKFDMESVNIVGRLFQFYSPIILFLPVQSVLARFFHSMEDTRTPLYATVVSVIINIVLSILLAKFIGLNGIAIATTIATFINVMLLCYYSSVKIGWDFTRFGFKDFLKILLSGAFMSVMIWFISSHTTDVWITVFMSVLLGFCLYFSCVFILMRNDIKKFCKLLKH